MPPKQPVNRSGLVRKAEILPLVPEPSQPALVFRKSQILRIGIRICHSPFRGLFDAWGSALLGLRRALLKFNTF